MGFNPKKVYLEGKKETLAQRNVTLKEILDCKSQQPQI